MEEALRGMDGAGRRALVVGCAYGHEAELASRRGFTVIAFDVSPSAVEGARARHPGSAVDYRVADLLDPPAEWAQAFDLVVEAITVQSMPPSAHAAATDSVCSFVAPGGELFVYTGTRGEDEPFDGPPWPLRPSEIDRFSRDLSLRESRTPDGRWCGWLTRPA